MERNRLLSARSLLACGVIAAGVIATAPHTTTFGANQPDELERAEINRDTTPRVATLRDRLIFGLQARLKSEVAFVDKVLLKVHTGALPRRMVDQTFFWARDRSGIDNAGQESDRPIIYFRPAMRARAKKIGVVL